MPENWIKALNSYRYCVNLSDYNNSYLYPEYFNFSPICDPLSTQHFEDHFRNGAGKQIALWLEVVFWKMYSQGGRCQQKTDSVAKYFNTYNITAEELIEACYKYIEDDSRSNLKRIIRLLGFTSNSIAIAATFPAFLRPDLFPMVDTRIAKWVGHCLDHHNRYSKPETPKLIRPRYLDTKATVLSLSDIDFVRSWTRWCRSKAEHLSNYTAIKWRPRDIEMAVFNAWGDKYDSHPKIDLEIIR